jgi:hypothetical protein
VRQLFKELLRALESSPRTELLILAALVSPCGILILASGLDSALTFPEPFTALFAPIQGALRIGALGFAAVIFVQLFLISYRVYREAQVR